MNCPRCGEVCHCPPEVSAAQGSVRPRFRVDSDHSPSSSVWVDPEPYDASEEHFSASLERSTSRFIPDITTASSASTDGTQEDDRTSRFNTGCEAGSSSERDLEPSAGNCDIKTAEAPGRLVNSDSSPPPLPPPKTGFPSSETDTSTHDPNSWKEEVAARLSSYRARRKARPPKYPSLSLNFESAAVPAVQPGLGSKGTGFALAVDQVEQQPVKNPPTQPVRLLPVEEDRENPLPTGRLIEFPRFFTPPDEPADQLAEPISDQPRILEVPEVELPAPALGGIVLEQEQEPEAEARPGFEVPLYSASIGRRLFATVIDLLVIGVSTALFGYIFFQLAKIMPSLTQSLVSAAVITASLWAGYQYLLLTYSGSTPGLRLAKLRLLHFDGSPVLRSTRRWRVLAAILSGISLGLGFAWCFLDEDALCWHDRITRTHLARVD